MHSHSVRPILSAKVVVGSLDNLLEAIHFEGVERLRYCAREVLCVLSCVQLSQESACVHGPSLLRSLQCIAPYSVMHKSFLFFFSAPITPVTIKTLQKKNAIQYLQLRK